jgi:hypothetical protein
MDWDFLRSSISITKIVDNIKLPKGKKKIVLERDNNYNLKGTLKFNDQKFLPDHDVVAGSFEKGFNIEGVSDNGSISYILESCDIGKISFKGASDFIGTADLGVSKLKIKFSETTPSHLREWYVNGPGYIHFGSAERKVRRYCTREHFLSNRNQKNSANAPLGNHFSTEFIWGRNKDFKFLITKISTLGPKWSTDVGIEYHKNWGQIPKLDERVKIEELCSFVFGKHLLSVGHTAYDEDGNIVEVNAHSPWGHSAQSLCSKPEYPPIRVHIHPKGNAEKIINFLLPKYLELSEPLCLKEALWNYWISFDIPPRPNLSIIASAIETIINSWFNSAKTKSHGVYMEKSDFIRLLGQELESIKEKFDTKYADEKKRILEKKIDEKTDGETMFNRIATAYEFGINERIRRFFEEISLNLTKAEKVAIDERHLFVHGHADYDKIDWHHVVRQANTLHTLFNKVLLRILDYKWDYIDRSVEGWPNTQLG